MPKVFQEFDYQGEKDIKLSLKSHSFLSSLRFYIRSSCKEVRRRKLYFCLAVSSILIVVMTTAIAQTIIDYTPLIFLRSAESDAGSQDCLIVPLGVEFEEDDGYNTYNIEKTLKLNATRIR